VHGRYGGPPHEQARSNGARLLWIVKRQSPSSMEDALHCNSDGNGSGPSIGFFGVVCAPAGVGGVAEAGGEKWVLMALFVRRTSSAGHRPSDQLAAVS